MELEIPERGFGRMTIGGQERGFHIGTYQSKVFCKVREIPLDTYLDVFGKFELVNNLENNVFVTDLLYSALVAYATFKGEPVDFTPEKVMFWTDMGDVNEVAKLFEVMLVMKREAPKKSDA